MARLRQVVELQFGGYDMSKALTTHTKHMNTHVPIVVFLAAIAMALSSGCASVRHRYEAEMHYVAGEYPEARESAFTLIDQEEDAAKLEKSGYILDNLYAGSTSLMCGDPAGAAEVFRRAGDGIKDQEESTFGSGYPTRTYDATMAANYLAISSWMLGDTDAARVAFRLTADAQDKAEERNARAIRQMQDDIEKQKAEEKENLQNSPQDNPELDAFKASFDDWAVYGDFQIPSAWFLDAVFALANAEDANDLEHASFAARKAQSMAPSKPSAIIYDMAEKVADGKIPRPLLDKVAVVVFENGLGPRINEKDFILSVPINGAIYTIAYALPELVRREVAYSKLVVRSGAVSLGETEPISDFDRVAVRVFKGRLPGIIASQILEATVKLVIQVAVSEAAGQKWGEGAKFLASIVTGAASVAITGTDTRHWNLLPKEVQAAVIKKPATANRRIDLCVPGGTEPIASVDLPEKGLSVVYVKVPAPGCPPLVEVLGNPDASRWVQNARPVPSALATDRPSGSSGWSPFGLSVINPIQLPWDDMDVYGLRLSVLYGRNEDVYGLDFGGLVSVADGDLWGLEFSGLVNSVGSSSGALQFAGLMNHCAGDFSGWQTAGIANSVGGSMGGIQIGCVNLANELGGLQLGVYNQAGRASGFQIGVINYAASMSGVQIGAINIISDSHCPFLPVINICF